MVGAALGEADLKAIFPSGGGLSYANPFEKVDPEWLDPSGIRFVEAGPKTFTGGTRRDC